MIVVAAPDQFLNTKMPYPLPNQIYVRPSMTKFACKDRGLHVMKVCSNSDSQGSTDIAELNLDRKAHVHISHIHVSLLIIDSSLHKLGRMDRSPLTVQLI